jgi:hypothetical protein
MGCSSSVDVASVDRVEQRQAKRDSDALMSPKQMNKPAAPAAAGADDEPCLDPKALRENVIKQALVLEQNQNEAEAALVRRRSLEAEITTVDAALSSLLTRYGIDGLEDTALFILKIIDKLVSQPDDPKFRTIQTKHDAFQRAVMQPLGALALLTSAGFELRGDDDNVLVLDSIDVGSLTKVRDRLRHELEQPRTDVGSRLQQVMDTAPRPWSSCLALYAAQELRAVISAMRMTSNTITRRITFSPGMKARLLPHTLLTSILFDRLRFVPDPNTSGLFLREEFLSAEELSYLRLLERDLQKWIDAKESHTPCALAVRQILSANPSPTAIKFLSVFRAGMGKIAHQPSEEKFQKIKVEAMMKIVGATIEHAGALFDAFGFIVAVDGVATLTHRVVDWDGLCNDLNRSIAAAGLVDV